MSFMPPPGGPPPGPPMGDPMGAMGGPPPMSPMLGGDPLSAGVAQQQQGIEMVKSGAMMVLAQMLGDQASPQAEAAQSSPGPLAGGPPPGDGGQFQ